MDGDAGQEPVDEVIRNGAPGAGIVADAVELDVEACHGLPAALPWRRQHGRADHVARGQAGEDLVEEFRREVAQQVDRTLRRRWRRRRRLLRFARGKHGWLVARVWWLECLVAPTGEWGSEDTGAEISYFTRNKLARPRTLALPKLGTVASWPPSFRPHRIFTYV